MDTDLAVRCGAAAVAVSKREYQGSTFEQINTGDDSYTYGNDFRLETRIDGVWRVIPQKRWAAIKDIDIGYMVPPHGSSQIGKGWGWLYGEQLPGEYRFLMEIKNKRTSQYFLVAAEFEIPA